MKILDINKDKEKVILIIHPMLASAKIMYEVLGKEFINDYRIIIPDISAHGEAYLEAYRSVASEAEALNEYLKGEEIKEISLAFGASLGASLLTELIKIAKIRFKALFFEGMSAIANDGILNKAMEIAILNKKQRAIVNPSHAIERMQEVYGEFAGKEMAEAVIKMDKESIKNIIYDFTHAKLPNLSPKYQEKCVFAYGEKDIALKKASLIIPKKYPNAKFIIWKGMDHCQKITNSPKIYADILKKYL